MASGIDGLNIMVGNNPIVTPDISETQTNACLADVIRKQLMAVKQKKVSTSEPPHVNRNLSLRNQKAKTLILKQEEQIEKKK